MKEEQLSVPVLLPAVFILMFTLPGRVCGGVGASIPLQRPEQCHRGQFFNSAVLRCDTCGSHQHRGPSALACICDDGFTVMDLGSPVVQCSSCNGTVSADGRRCLRCDEEVGRCQCGAGQTRVENLTSLTTSCLTCSPDNLGTPASPICGLCPDSFYTVTDACLCPGTQLTGGVCFTSTDAANVPGTVPQDSIWIREYLDSSFLGCMSYSNITACQLLANMVTLDAGGEGSKAERLYEVASSHQPPLPYLPGLYESSDRQAFPRGLAFSSNEKLPLMLTSYSADGHFLRWQEVTGGILQMCPDMQTRLDSAFLFGTSYQQSCSISVQELVAKHPLPVFHQLFLRYRGDDGMLMVWPVPIQSRHPQSSNSGRSVQRFYLVDGLSGRAGSLTSPPGHVHYLSSITLSVQIPASVDRAPPPLQLHLQYRSARLADNTSVQVSFTVTYSMDEDSMHLATSISVAVFSVLSLLVSLLETSSWSRRSGQQTLNFTTLIKFLAFLSGNLGNTFFLVTLGTGVYWLVAFKAQRSIVTTVLPSAGGTVEVYFKSFVALAFVLKSLQLLHVTLVQVSVDIFLIDWERPNNKRRAAGPPLLQSAAASGASSSSSSSSAVQPAGPSAWRRLLVANEWNELMTMRKSSPALTLLIALLLLQVLGLVNLASCDLQVTLRPGADSFPSPQSPLLRYALTSSVWLGLGLLQVVLYHLLYERCVEDEVRQFVDLCSISNVSVLVLMQRCHGYYLHGRSVHGYADVSIEALRTNLRNEEEDRCARRGLESQSDVQVFEVSLTERARQQLQRVLLPLSELGERRRRGETAEREEQTARVSHNMNTLLCLFLQHALKDMDYIVKDKSAVEKMMKYEFQLPAERSIFYRDKDGVSFGEVLCYGQETLLLVFDTLLFSVIDLASQNLVLAAVLTYIVQQVLNLVRAHMSRRNLSSKTLVDQCFLI